MIVGIHPDKWGEASYSDKWAQFLQARDIQVRFLDLLAPGALDQVRQCDGVMCLVKHIPQDKQSLQRILYTIEHYLHIPVYPDNYTAWHYDEKVAQFYLLQTLQAPVPRTWLFWDRDAALASASGAPYPVVFKLSGGAGSANVIKIKNSAEAKKLICRAFGRGVFPYTMNEFTVSASLPRNLRQLKSMLQRSQDALRYVWYADYPALPDSLWWRPEKGYVYFQEFLAGNDYDTRITVIGNRAFGFRRLNRPGDFRASGSGRIVHDPEAIDRRCLEIAFQVSERGNFQSMAYDFLYRHDEPVICEISYTYADWAVQACPGHWKRDLSWVQGHMWPEEAQVWDFEQRVRNWKFG